MSGRELGRFCLAWSLVAVTGASCRTDLGRDPEPSPEAGDAPLVSSERGRDLSPTETISTLHALHRGRDFTRLGPWIVKDLRTASLAYLEAVDVLLAANESLRRATRDRYHGAFTSRWDLSAIRNNLGPFSQDVRIVGERIDGDRAIVTLQEGDHVPLFHARLERRGDRWLYRPTDVSPRTLPGLRRLARMLDDVAASVRRGAPPESVDEAFRYRVMPQVARVQRAEAEAITFAAPIDD